MSKYIGKEKLMEVFSQRLNDLLIDQNKTGNWLAETTGISAPRISNYIRGKESVPSALNLRNIAEALNVSSDYLLGLTDSKKQIDDPQRAAVDYLGLNDEAVEYLHHLKTQTLWSTRNIDFGITSSGFVNKKSDFLFPIQGHESQASIKSDIITDECMQCVLVSATYCRYISQFIQFVCERFSDEYLQQTPNFLLDHDLTLLGRYMDLYDLQLFKAQQAIVDYIRAIAPITDHEDTNKIIQEVQLQIHEYLQEAEFYGND